MNVMKGKKYYVSVGYIDKKEHRDFDAKFIKSLIVHCRDGTMYYDEENDITLPLMPVNQIQKKKDKFEFKFLFFPSKASWYIQIRETKVDIYKPISSEEIIKCNVFGLFESTVEDGIENVRLIGFYERRQDYFYSSRKAVPILIEVDKDRLTEEKQYG